MRHRASASLHAATMQLAQPVANARSLALSFCLLHPPPLLIMPCFIRPATAADVPLILEFIRSLADYEKLTHEVVATEATLRVTLFPADPATRPAAECILAFTDEDQPAGFALYFFNYSTFLAKPGLYLEDLFVRPELRGQGIGKALLLQLAKLANQHGCGRMEWSVLDWNQPAIDFYQSLGAELKSEWTTCRLTGPALARFA
jgi:GNAT superfamily N-acetyltransferase